MNRLRIALDKLQEGQEDLPDFLTLVTNLVDYSLQVISTDKKDTMTVISVVAFIKALADNKNLVEEFADTYLVLTAPSTRKFKEELALALDLDENSFQKNMSINFTCTADVKNKITELNSVLENMKVLKEKKDALDKELDLLKVVKNKLFESLDRQELPTKRMTKGIKPVEEDDQTFEDIGDDLD